MISSQKNNVHEIDLSNAWTKRFLESFEILEWMKAERKASVLQECNLQSANNKLLIVVSPLVQRSKKDNFFELQSFPFIN